MRRTCEPVTTSSGVAVRDDAAAKERAADALRAAHAESLHYYAKNYVEDLGGDA